MDIRKIDELTTMSKLANVKFQLAANKLTSILPTQDHMKIEAARDEAVATYEALLDITISNSRQFYEADLRLKGLGR